MIVWFNKDCINKITTPTQARAAIAALQTVIDTLAAAAGAAAMNANIKEYKIDDGVTKAQFEYQDVGAISAHIISLRKLQEIYLQQPGMNSRVIRMMDSKNMPNFGPINSLFTGG